MKNNSQEVLDKLYEQLSDLGDTIFQFVQCLRYEIEKKLGIDDEQFSALLDGIIEENSIENDTYNYEGAYYVIATEGLSDIVDNNYDLTSDMHFADMFDTFNEAKIALDLISKKYDDLHIFEVAKVNMQIEEVY